MKLNQFYSLLRSHAEITLEQAQRIVYHGPLNGIPDSFDNAEVINFAGTNTGYIFYLK